MNSKLIISDFHDGYLLGFHLEEDKLVRIHNFTEESVLGNIYCGYVKDVVKNINAAFVEFDRDKKGYLSLRDLTETIHQGDRVLVQVSSDKIKSKDYTLTTRINLCTECLVLTVGNTDISISKKITDNDIRERLKYCLKNYRNEEYGFILRTNSVGFSLEDILFQAEKLSGLWNQIKKSFEHATAKSALLRNDNRIKICEEFLEKTAGEIITDNLNIHEILCSNFINVSFFETGKISLSNKYALEKHLRNSLNKNVWLKSGAYLVIEPTEALTVIDVNTGKADCHTNRNETLKKINIEAAKEIARQIQIRNLSGIIIVDFINMTDSEFYYELEQIMKECVKYDFSPCYIVGFTKLGLMEISRKKKEKPLYEILRNEG